MARQLASVTSSSAWRPRLRAKPDEDHRRRLASKVPLPPAAERRRFANRREAVASGTVRGVEGAGVDGAPGAMDVEGVHVKMVGTQLLERGKPAEQPLHAAGRARSVSTDRATALDRGQRTVYPSGDADGGGKARSAEHSAPMAPE